MQDAKNQDEMLGWIISFFFHAKPVLYVKRAAYMQTC